VSPNSCKKEVPENSVVAVEVAGVVVLTVFFVIAVAGLVVTAVVVFTFRDNGTFVFEHNHTNNEEEEQRIFATRIVT